METLIEVMIYLTIIGTAVLMAGLLLYGIHRMVVKIRRINARIIWRCICAHRRRHARAENE